MNTASENQFNNLGIVSRISHVLLAKTLAFATAYGTVFLSDHVSSGWFVLMMAAVVYLLFTGLIGWTPFIALDNQFKNLGLKKQEGHPKVPGGFTAAFH